MKICRESKVTVYTNNPTFLALVVSNHDSTIIMFMLSVLEAERNSWRLSDDVAQPTRSINKIQVSYRSRISMDDMKTSCDEQNIFEARWSVTQKFSQHQNAMKKGRPVIWQKSPGYITRDPTTLPRYICLDVEKSLKACQPLEKEIVHKTITVTNQGRTIYVFPYV